MKTVFNTKNPYFSKMINTGYFVFGFFMLTIITRGVDGLIVSFNFFDGDAFSNQVLLFSICAIVNAFLLFFGSCLLSKEFTSSKISGIFHLVLVVFLNCLLVFDTFRWIQIALFIVNLIASVIPTVLLLYRYKKE